MRVLIVEDDRALGAFLKSGLELQGHRVEWVEDGDSALARAAAEHPDLVLLDLSLPKRDGLEVLTKMRVRHGGRFWRSLTLPITFRGPQLQSPAL